MLRQYLAPPIYESGEGLVKVIMCSDILDVSHMPNMVSQ